MYSYNSLLFPQINLALSPQLHFQKKLQCGLTFDLGSSALHHLHCAWAVTELALSHLITQPAFLKLMCEYTTLQWERSNKKKHGGDAGGGSGGSSRSRGGGSCGEGSPNSCFMKFRYCSLRLMKHMAKGLPQLTMEQTVVRWRGGLGL